MTLTVAAITFIGISALCANVGVLLNTRRIRRGMKPITEHLADMIRDRADVGKEKYGHTIDREDLSLDEWCQHAIEELLDAAQYIEAIRRRLEGKQ